MDYNNMKTTINIGSFVLSALSGGVFIAAPMLAHDIDVHAKISEAAVKSAVWLQEFLQDNFIETGLGPNDPAFLNSPPLPHGNFTMGPINWIKYGSKVEDGGESLT